MPADRTLACRRIHVYAALVLALLVAGCGGGRYPATGRVLVKGKALQGKVGAVVLKPDLSKGNPATQAPVGVLQPDGSFSLATDGRPGAKPGWYKVVVVANDATANPNEDSRRVLNARYQAEATTPLAVEVVPHPTPEHYDLQLLP